MTVPRGNTEPGPEHAVDCFWNRANPSGDGDEAACCSCGAYEQKAIEHWTTPALLPRFRTRFRARVVKSKPYGAWLYYTTGRENGWSRLTTIKLMWRFREGL